MSTASTVRRALAIEAVPFPGTSATADGSEAVVWVEAHIGQGACAYPITPSTLMGGAYQVAVANGGKNLWGEPLSFLELESEHSSASTCEGFALAGGRVTNFTSGQGLILMKEVLYVISGKRLPVVFHIGARALTSHSLNIHAGHDDVMGVADCGWGMLFARNAQEAADLALIARRAAEESATPFFNVQDGFLTTHTIESLQLPEPELMREYVGAPKNLVNLMDPHHPMMSGVVQNQDSYMKGKIAQRAFYDCLPTVVQRSMARFAELTGRRYGLVDGYRLEDADYALVGMGTMLETAAATADYARERDGVKVGALHVTCFRPFPGPQIVEALAHLKAIAVIERLDNPASQSNPLTSEIKAAFADALSGAPGYPRIRRAPVIYSGSAGLGGRDIRPADLIAVTKHMAACEPRRYFVLGIKHELALTAKEEADVRPAGAFSMRGHSIGGYGSVTTNRIIAAVVGSLSGLRVQAYPLYGSEKKGLPTTYYLTVADEPIRVHAEMTGADFVPLNSTDAFRIGNPVAGVRPGGTIFLQHSSRDPSQVWASIPDTARDTIRQNHIRVLALDAVKIAQEVSSKPELAQRMQGIVLLGVFLRVAPFLARLNLSEADTSAAIEAAVRKYFAKQSEAVIQDNLKAIRRGGEAVFEIPRDIIDADAGEQGDDKPE
jgi:pyruvate-ferredoxin/flavodoxin oxidoreductase